MIAYVKNWYDKSIILLIKPSCLQQYIAKRFHVYKNILSNKKQNYTENEHSIQGYWGCLQGTLIFEFQFCYKSMTQSSLLVVCF